MHPYHYSKEKSSSQRLIDWVVPIGLFLIYFNFYNFGKFSPAEMVKTSGLMAISLLALTLLIGPLARFIPSLNLLKAHRKFWGIASFLFLLAHLSLVLVFYFKLDLLELVNPSNPKFTGLITGILAALVLFIITLSSRKNVIKKLDPKVWKLIQTTSYIALILAVAHFYLMEQVNGVLVIKRALGRITFWFATFAIAIRLIVLLIPGKKSK